MLLLAVSTGVDQFVRPQEVAELYPFPDIEWLYVGAAVALWLLWHVLQIGGETRENREAEEMYEEIGLGRVMFHGGSALVATPEEWAEQQGREHRGSPAPPPPAPPPPPE